MPNIILLENGTSGVLMEDGTGFVMEESGAADTTVPTVTITEPAAGATISGATNPFTATATDNVAVRGIKFYLDNVLIGTEDTTSPYSVNIDAATLAAGTHTLKAVSYDTAGNPSAEATRSVTVGSAAPIWEAGRIFDIDFDNWTGANGLHIATPSSVSSAYSATDVSGRQGTLYAYTGSAHTVVLYSNEGGTNKGSSIEALPAGMTSFSVGLIARQQGGNEAVATRIISANTDWYITFTRNGAQFFAGTTIVGENPSSITPDVLHVALAEISPTGAAFYVDGTLKGSKTGTFSIPAQIFLGWSTGGFGEPAMAFIGRVKAWNKVLSANERAAWFADMKASYGTP